MKLFLLSLALGFFAVSAQAAEQFVVTETPPAPAVGCKCDSEPAGCTCKPSPGQKHNYSCGDANCPWSKLASDKQAPAACGPNGCGQATVYRSRTVVTRRAAGSACGAGGCGRARVLRFRVFRRR
jgi:hypothetical protein